MNHKYIRDLHFVFCLKSNLLYLETNSLVTMQCSGKPFALAFMWMLFRCWPPPKQFCRPSKTCCGSPTHQSPSRTMESTTTWKLLRNDWRNKTKSPRHGACFQRSPDPSHIRSLCNAPQQAWHSQRTHLNAWHVSARSFIPYLCISFFFFHEDSKTDRKSVLSIQVKRD